MFNLILIASLVASLGGVAWAVYRAGKVKQENKALKAENNDLKLRTERINRAKENRDNADNISDDYLLHPKDRDNK